MGPESSTQNRVGNMVRGMGAKDEDTTGLGLRTAWRVRGNY